MLRILSLRITSMTVVIDLLSQTVILCFCKTLSFALVGTSGLEPPTSRLSGVRSNHLSYAPI